MIKQRRGHAMNPCFSDLYRAFLQAFEKEALIVEKK